MLGDLIGEVILCLILESGLEELKYTSSSPYNATVVLRLPAERTTDNIRIRFFSTKPSHFKMLESFVVQITLTVLSQIAFAMHFLEVF